MPGGMFLPIFGMIASFAISSLLKPDVPKMPSVAPAPKPPKPAPPPEPAPEVKQEPAVKPEDAVAAQQEQQRAIKRRATNATSKPLDIISEDGSVNYKTLLGE